MAGAAAGAQLAAAFLQAGTATAGHLTDLQQQTSMAHESILPKNWDNLNTKEQELYLQHMDKETSKQVASHNRRMGIANAVTGAMHIGGNTSSAVMQASQFADKSSSYFTRETEVALQLHGDQIQDIQTKFGLRPEKENASDQKTVSFLSKPMNSDVAMLLNAAEAKWPEHMQRHDDFISKTLAEQDRLLTKPRIFKGLKTFFTNVSKVPMILVSELNCHNEEELTEIECKPQETICFEDDMQAPLGLYTVRFVLDATPVEIECFVNRKLAGRSVQTRQIMIVNNVWLADDDLKRVFARNALYVYDPEIRDYEEKYKIN